MTERVEFHKDVQSFRTAMHVAREAGHVPLVIRDDVVLRQFYFDAGNVKHVIRLYDVRNAPKEDRQDFMTPEGRQKMCEV